MKKYTVALCVALMSVASLCANNDSYQNKIVRLNNRLNELSTIIAQKDKQIKAGSENQAALRKEVAQLKQEFEGLQRQRKAIRKEHGATFSDDGYHY